MGERIRVLHVEDDPGFRDLTATYLEREAGRITIETAAGPEGGLEKLDETTDCIVSDYEMPNQNGVEFLQTVREQHPSLPFILFTGKGSETVASEAVSRGVTDYLQKKGEKEQFKLLANRIENAVEAQRVDEQLTERTRRLETLIENLPGVVYQAHNERGWPMENIEGNVEALTGYTSAEIEDETFSWEEEVLHPADREGVWESVQEPLDTGHTFEVTYRLRTKSGETKWVWERGQRIPTAPDEPEKLEGFITDITEQKDHEKALKEERLFIQQGLDALDELFYVLDPDGTLVRWNERAVEMSGLDPDEIEGMNAASVFRPEDRPKVEAAIEDALETGTSRVEAGLVTADGSGVLCEFRGVRLTDSEGELLGVAGVGRDISTRREREHELEQYETLINTVHDGIFVVNETQEIEMVNRAGATVTGYAPAEVEGRTVRDLMAEFAAEESSVDRVTATLDRVIAGDDEFEGTPSEEIKVMLPIGTETIEYQFTPFWTGEQRKVAVVGRNVTDRIEREERLQQSNEQLEAFASFLSHDLRNPLQIAQTRLELAETEYDSEHHEKIADALDRMGQLIDDVLTLAKQENTVENPVPVDLETVAEDSWRQIDAPTVRFESETSGRVVADHDRLEQLLVNLLRNSVEHGPPDDGTADHLTIRMGAFEDGFYVEDDGCGLPETDCDVLFESGYTTKREGTGLGLSIVSEIVDAHGWTITATESQSGGARFEVTGVDSPQPSHE